MREMTKGPAVQAITPNSVNTKNNKMRPLKGADMVIRSSRAFRGMGAGVVDKCLCDIRPAYRTNRGDARGEMTIACFMDVLYTKYSRFRPAGRIF